MEMDKRHPRKIETTEKRTDAEKRKNEGMNIHLRLTLMIKLKSYHEITRFIKCMIESVLPLPIQG
jgi:hypothetical protein